MNKIQKLLFTYKDEKYANFQKSLTPGVDESLFIGVRVPEIRKIAKQHLKDKEYIDFLDELPHKYFDENMLHGELISNINDYDECIKKVEKFLPYVDNWAVCDTMSPKCFSKHKDELLKKIKQWAKSKNTYTCRFAIGMLMKHYLDEDYKEDYLTIPSKVCSDEYYIKMMQAWFYATALSKKWDDTIVYLQDRKLNKWIHNKTIQKANESYRISDEQKQYLKTLRMK